MDDVGPEVIEQALVVGDGEDAELGTLLPHLPDAGGDDLEGVDVEDQALTPARDAEGVGTDGLDGGGITVAVPDHAMADPRLLEALVAYGYRIGPSATLAELTGG